MLIELLPDWATLRDVQDLVGAFDSIDRVSIYRNLNQFKATGVLHEVESNIYIFCTHECDEHAHLLLFCQRCHKHQEIKDHGRIENFMSALGILRFFGKRQPIVLKGICSACTSAASTSI